MTNLTILRRQAGMTQAELARLLGLPRQEICRLENGWLRKIRPAAEQRLLTFFGPPWTLDTLLSEPELKSAEPDAA